MKQLRSKKRSQQWIAVLLAVVMVVGHMAMASAYDPNAGGDEYINAPLLDLTNGGSGAGVSGIGDGSGTGGNGVLSGNTDGEFTFDPYSNTITGSNGGELPPEGEGEGEGEEVEGGISLDPDTFGEGAIEPQPGDDYSIIFRVNGVSGEGNKQVYDVTFFITSISGEAIPEGTEIIAEFPAFVTRKSLEDAAEELKGKSRGEVIKSFNVEGGDGDRKVLTMITNKVTTDQPWQIGLRLSLSVDKLYSHLDNTVSVSVGDTVGGGLIIIDKGIVDWGEHKVEVQKQLENATDFDGKPVIDNDKGIAVYLVDVKLPKLEASYDELNAPILATIEDTFLNERYALSDASGENFVELGSQQEADLIAHLKAQVMEGLEAAGWDENFDNRQVEVELKYNNEGYANGFKISIFGNTTQENGVFLRLRYIAAPTRPLQSGENEFVKNNVIVNYNEMRDEEIVEVLANNTYASLWSKQVDGGRAILLDETWDGVGEKPTKQMVEFQFVITVLGGGMGIFGETLLDDYLTEEFTYSSSTNYSGTIENFNGLKDKSFSPPAGIHFGVYVSENGKHVKIGHNTGDYIDTGVYTVTVVAEMDLTKIKPGQSGINKVGNEVVYIYRNAVLSVGKDWEPPPEGVVAKESGIRFELYRGSELIEWVELSKEQIAAGKKAEFKFWYNTPGLRDGANNYTIKEILLDEGSDYATIADKPFTVFRYTDTGASQNERGVYIVGAHGDSPGEHEIIFENPYDDGLGEIMFRKYSTRPSYPNALIDGAEFKLEMAKGSVDANGQFTSTSSDRINVQLEEFDSANDDKHGPDEHNDAQGNVYAYVGAGGDTATTILTDGGYATLIHLPYEVDGYNVYVLTEVTPPDGHDFGVTTERYFQLGKNNKYDLTGNDFENPIFDDGKITILKVDDAEPTSNPLSGARFTITRGTYENGNFTVENKSDGTPVYQRTSILTDVATDGKVTFDGLTNGVYEIREVGAPFGYRRFAGAVYVKISQQQGQLDIGVIETIGPDWESAATINGTNIELTWVNVKRFGFIEFIKYRADVGMNDAGRIEGAKFLLYKTDKTFSEDEEIMLPYMVNNVHLEAVSDEDGVVRFNNLPFGYYIVVEVDAGDDEYFVPEANRKISFILVDDEMATTVFDQDLLKGANVNDKLEGSYAGDYWLKNPRRGSIVFYKVDWVTPTKILPGAQFVLFKFDSTIVGEDKFAPYPSTGPQMTATSDVNGRVAFDGLEYGYYRVRETVAPGGDYYIDPIPGNQPYVDFNVDEDTGPDQTKEFPHYTYNGTRFNWRNTTRGSIVFTKYNSGNDRLAGAVFELQEPDGSGWKPYDTPRVTTDNTGVVRFNQLPHGRYRVVEITPPTGYFGDNPNGVIFVVEVTSSGVTTRTDPADALEVMPNGEIRWRNFKLGYIEFFKIKNGDSDERLKGAEFSLYKVTLNANGVETYRSARIGEPVTTLADGKVRFNNLDHGTYVVVETKAPEGYETVVPSPRKYFEVTESFTPLNITGTASLTGTGTEYYWPNTPKLGKLTVYKYDVSDPDKPEGKDSPLNGVQFQLFTLDANDDPVYGNTVTVSNGRAVFSNLEAGTYYLLETYVNEALGYSKSTKHATPEEALKYPFVVGPGTDDEWTLEEDVFNPRILKTITFIKGEAGTNNVLAGAKFTLKRNSAMNGVTYEAHETADENGRVTFENVPYGTYTLTETLPPKGYAPIVPRTNIRVDAATDDVYDLGRINDYPYELVVIKSDADTEGEGKVYLPGAKFRIYVRNADDTIQYVKAVGATSTDGLNTYEYVELVDAAGDATIFETGSDGKFTVSKMAYLPGNKYLIKETEPPQGYVLIDEEFEAKFDQPSDTKVVQEVDVPNGAVYGSIEISKIDGVTKGPLAGVVFELKRRGAEADSEILLITDESGKATANNLIYGTYELRELKSARGYKAELRDADNQVVDMLLVDIETHGEIVKVGPINNYRVVGDVELTKYGSLLEGGYAVLPGAQFLLKPIELTWDEVSGEITEALVSDDESTFRFTMSEVNGIVAFRRLAYGAYIIEENLAPSGYTKVETEEQPRYAIVQVGLSVEEFESLRAWMEANYDGYDNLRFVYDTEDMEWTNNVVTGSFSFQKQDDNGTNLQGALFELNMVNSDGSRVPVTLKKDDDGEFTFEGLGGVATVIDTNDTGEGNVGQLPYGRYILTETKAPDNYMIDKADHEIFIYGANTHVSLVIENSQMKGRLRVIKKDADSDYIYLSGAVVNVYTRNENDEPGTLIGTVVTEIGGTGELEEDLPLGEYIAIEMEPPEGYSLNPETASQTFDITAENFEKIMVLTYENTRKTYSLRILKVEDIDGERVPIEVAGAQFLVTHTASEGYWYPVTNDKGVAELKDIPAGDYTIIETMAPAGYIRDNTVRSVTVNDDEETVEISIVNKRIMGGVHIRKLDQDGEILNNAKFELYREGQTVPMKLTETGANAYVPDENGEVTELTVGEATISGLEAGTYRLVETEVPEGYIKPDDARTFTVSATTHEKLQDVDIINIKAEAAFAIRKVDADDSGLRLQGAVFQLFRANTQGVYEYVRSRTTDSTGYAVFSGLEPGSYRIDEVTPPTGYRLWNTPLYFDVTDDLKIAIGSNEYTMIDGVVIATVVNHKSNQYFQLRKVDANTGNVLQNARFSLTGSGDNSSYYTVLTSGASGLTERVSLPAGTYYLQELAAPGGYVRTTATFTVVVDGDGVLVNGTRLTGPSVFTYEMPNTPDSRTALLYKTDASSRAALSGAVFSITQRGTGSSWTLSTNSSGRTGNFTLTPGYTYDIVETTTPSGYNRPMQGWTVSVSSSGAISVSGRGIVAYTDSGVVLINIDNTRTTTTTTTTTTPTPGTTTTPRTTSTATRTSSGSSSTTRASSSTDEEPIPLGPGLPRTGQYTNVGLLILGAVIMLISCAALMLYVLKSRKEREEGYNRF